MYISYLEYKYRGGLPQPFLLYKNCPFQSIPVRLVYILKKKTLSAKGTEGGGSELKSQIFFIDALPKWQVLCICAQTDSQRYFVGSEFSILRHSLQATSAYTTIHLLLFKATLPMLNPQVGPVLTALGYLGSPAANLNCPFNIFYRYFIL